MDYLEVSLLWQTVSSIAYLGYCLIKFGLTDSISATWYEHKSWVGKSLFTIWLWCLIFPMMLFLGDGKWDWVMRLGAIGIGLVGTYPNYKDTWAEKWHVLGALIGIVVLLVGAWLSWGVWWPLAVTGAISGVTWLYKFKGATYIAEALAIITLIIAEHNLIR